jgi:hypothetical protein
MAVYGILVEEWERTNRPRKRVVEGALQAV